MTTKHGTTPTQRVERARTALHAAQKLYEHAAANTSETLPVDHPAVQQLADAATRYCDAEIAWLDSSEGREALARKSPEELARLTSFAERIHADVTSESEDGDD